MTTLTLPKLLNLRSLWRRASLRLLSSTCGRWLLGLCIVTLAAASQHSSQPKHECAMSEKFGAVLIHAVHPAQA